MKLKSVIFGSRDTYERMADVLRYSVYKNSPKTPLKIYHKRMDRELMTLGRQRDKTVVENAMKTKYHCEIVQNAEKGEVIGLLDCDTMVMRDLSCIEKKKFDLAITYRPNRAKLMFNSGVVFVRISNKTKQLYRDWLEIAREMLQNNEFYNKWRAVFGGINQTSLGYLTTLDDYKKIKILGLECQEWNCENETWDLFNEETRIVHILGELRRGIFRGGGYPDEATRRLAGIWHRYEWELLNGES